MTFKKYEQKYSEVHFRHITFMSVHIVYAEIFNISCFLIIGYLCVCSMEEEGDSNLCIETDSDTADKKDGTKYTAKWTQEEVSEKRTFNNNTLMLIL